MCEKIIEKKRREKRTPLPNVNRKVWSTRTTQKPIITLCFSGNCSTKELYSVFFKLSLFCELNTEVQHDSEKQKADVKNNVANCEELKLRHKILHHVLILVIMWITMASRQTATKLYYIVIIPLSSLTWKCRVHY